MISPRIANELEREVHLVYGCRTMGREVQGGQPRKQVLGQIAWRIDGDEQAE